MMKVYVMILIIATVVGNSILAMGGTAYGEANNLGDTQDASDGGIGSGIVNIIGGSVGALAGFFESLLPSISGIWLLDDIINSLGIFAGYQAIVLLRGGGG